MRRAAPLLLLAGTVIAVLLCIELQTPYYFLQDDNRHQYLPLFVHAYDSLMKGNLALYDFHQFLGTPNLAMGQTAVLYAPMYLALGASQLFFGHVFAGLDLLVGFHLVVAALGMYLLVRTLGLSRPAAFLAGISWPLCSFVVYVGDSWVVYTAFAAWFPFLLTGAALLLRKPGPASASLLVAAHTILFLVGHPQNFLYGILFEALFLLLLYGSGYADAKSDFPRVKRVLRWYLLSFVLTAVACAPLLLPMLSQMQVSADRSTALSYVDYSSGPAILKELVRGLTDPFGQGDSLDSARYYSYVGLPMLFLAALGFLAGLFRLARAVTPRRFWPENAGAAAADRPLLFVWIATVPLAVFAFLWATNTWITPLLYHLPILDRFRWPFKQVFFMAFFLILLGAAGLHALSGHPQEGQGRIIPRPVALSLDFVRRLPWRRIAAAGIVFLLLALQTYDLAHLYLDYPRKSLKRQSEPLPLSEPFAPIIGAERLASVGFDVGTSRSGLTLGYDYAALWGLYQFAGYDPFVSADNSEHVFGLNYDAMIDRNGGAGAAIDSLDYLRSWGVRWYVAPVGTPSAELAGMVPVASDDDRVLYRDDLAVPMAFALVDGSAVAEGVSLDIGTNRLTVHTDRAAETTVVVAFLANPSFVLTVDGVPRTLGRDATGRMTFAMPAGAHVAQIVYQDRSYQLGIVVLLVGALATGAVAFVADRRRRRPPTV